ncbi:MAG: hypothetical protein ACYS8W_05050 [Planctomycetota bacterium]|jgi:hypothetical protein
MAIAVPCPKCAKRISLPEEYAGRKFKCTSCKAKIRIPNPEKDKVGIFRCQCGNKFQTWNIYISDGVFCPACKEITKGAQQQKELPKMIIVEEDEDDETKQREASPEPSIDDIPDDELELVDELELADDYEVIPEIEELPDKRKAGDRRKGDRRKGDRRRDERRDG